MIQTNNITKIFDGVRAVDNVTATIHDGQVFGLIGTNGAGKSTFLRMIAGVLEADEGKVTIDGEEAYDNVEAKEKFFYISDDQHFLNNAKPLDMSDYYKTLYPNFDLQKFLEYLDRFDLPKHRKISTFSKGMKKQLSVILGIAANTKYILCDETFDGLDPVMRQGVKSIFALEMSERGLTPIIASHNLREVEDICDQVGVLYKGGLLLSNHLDDMKLGIFKIQCAFKDEQPDFTGLDIVNRKNMGSVYTLTIRGELSDIKAKVKELEPAFYEVLPLTLEEIFVIETEAKGYDVKKLLQ